MDGETKDVPKTVQGDVNGGGATISEFLTARGMRPDDTNAKRLESLSSLVATS